MRRPQWKLLPVILMVAALAVTATSTRANHQTDLPTGWAGYTFESGQTWTTSEGEFKLAEVDVVDTPIYQGHKVMRLRTELRGGAVPGVEDIFRHTETVAYFNGAVPEGLNVTGPYTMTGRLAQGFVFVPASLAGHARIQIITKDSEQRNGRGHDTPLDAGNTGRWLLLYQIVGTTIGEGGLDSGFDPANINAVGIRITTTETSTFSGIVEIFVDAVWLQNPQPHIGPGIFELDFLPLVRRD